MQENMNLIFDKDRTFVLGKNLTDGKVKQSKNNQLGMNQQIVEI